MGRGSTQILIRKIVTSLAKSPKSISQLAEETELDRTAIVKYLNILKESGLLIEEAEGTSKIFTIVPTYRTDTYFGLPLDEETEKKVNTLYHLIKKNWLQQTTRDLLRTHAQKIAYKVISSCELNIPSGWYIYGGISIASYDDSMDYHYYGFPKDTEKCIKEVTAEFAKNKHAWQSKKQQYEEAGKELYTTKEEILSILYSGRFESHPKNSMYILVKKLRRLISLAPKDSSEDYHDIVDSFQDLMLDITNKLTDDQISMKKREIISLFESVWKYIALFNFKHDLTNYYSKQVLDIHFKLDILQQEDEVIEYGSDLQLAIPENEETNEIKSKLDKALKQIKPLSLKEQEERKKEIQKMKKELGEKEFQKYLLKSVGLN
jgi:DNA-binding transcriptional ArsR family regulator